MNRREFIAITGGAAVWPLVASAQQSTNPVVGFLNVASPEGYAHHVTAFRDGLNAAETGQLVEVLYRGPGSMPDKSVLALARMAPLLNAAQTQAILKSLLKDLNIARPDTSRANREPVKAASALADSLAGPGIRIPSPIRRCGLFRIFR